MVTVVFRLESTSIKKTLGFRSFSVFRISDKRLCTCTALEIELIKSDVEDDWRVKYVSRS
jgi:hypothetical protein